MARRPLECEVMKGSRHEDYIDVHADPDNPAELREVLTGWLTANKWDERLWHRFWLLVRYQGEGKVRRKVRA